MTVQMCEWGRHPFDFAPGGDGVKVEAAWGFDARAMVELYFCSADHLAAYLFEVRGVDPPVDSG
jgi:hypothetical protein